jgi:septal ring factor EnvC (AmiA/AmiB activator)
MARTPTRTRLTAALLATALLAAPGAAQQDRRESLEALRARIRTLEERIAEQSVERDDAAKALKGLELEIGAANRELAALRARSLEQQRRRQTLDAETARAQARIAREREALARQVRLTYMNGREEALKLLLSQETPADFGRMAVYYDYFNRARSARIDTVSEELQALSRLAAEGREVEAEVARLERAKSAEIAKLDRSREERRRLLADLDESLSSADDEVARLKAREQRLAKLVAELGEAMARFPRDSEDPFAAAKGRLVWPVPGKLAEDYGQPIGDGTLRRSGVLFSTDEGTPVRAIYHGRVAFADWLPGLGLLIVIDHGDGYMSLYGHNDALLKEAGDWVTPGEAIAEAGDTGGQARSSLYFEIRHGGKPVDPHDWIAD